MLAVIEVIMNDISKYVPITKAKNDLLELIRQIENVGFREVPENIHASSAEG
jgi:hypothetical protein